MHDAAQGARGLPPAPTLEYPLRYTFKIMGLAADDFPDHAGRLVAAVIGDAPVLSRSVRPSAGGKYQSVSVVVRLDTEAQRRAVYQALWQDDRVVYYL
jgi:putative lipoic acid-binding regulatory protein